MKLKLIMATLVAALAGALFVATAGTAGAQTVTSDPITTTPGYPGCGGNAQIQDVTADYTCGNQRTFHLGPITRTVIAISTFHADGTASTTFTLTGGNAPQDLKLRIVSHTGISSSTGPVIDEVTGTMLKGTKGPVTLNYLFDCGQVDIKAILTGNGDSAGRISGPFVCKVAPVVTTTTAPTTAPGATTTPTTAPLSSGSPTTVSGAPGASAESQVVAPLPATGSETSPLAFYGVLGLLVGLAFLAIAGVRRRARA